MHAPDGSLPKAHHATFAAKGITENGLKESLFGFRRLVNEIFDEDPKPLQVAFAAKDGHPGSRVLFCIEGGEPVEPGSSEAPQGYRKGLGQTR